MDEAAVQAQFARAKAYLMKADKDGVSVYDQLTRLMEQLLDDADGKCSNGVHATTTAASRDALLLLQHVDAFDQVLQQLRTHTFVRGASTAPCAEPLPIAPDVLATLARNRRLLDRPAPQVRTTIEQPNPYTTITTTTVTPPVAPTYASVTEQNAYWTAAGFGMRDDDAFLLDRSITRLAMAKSLHDVRFVGKVFGLRADYYVLATRRYVPDGVKVYVEEPTAMAMTASAAAANASRRRRRRGVHTPVPPEPAYVGCNRLSFWVTTHPAEAWQLLPDVTPQQMVAARAVRRLFTGDLRARVVTTSSFAWRDEAELLRATLGRLVCATTIAPQGALEEVEHDDDDEDDEDEDDEVGGRRAGTRPRKEAVYRALTAPSPTFAEEPLEVTAFAQQLARWVHVERPVRASGRQTAVPTRRPRDDDDNDEDNKDDDEDERDDEDDDEDGSTNGDDAGDAARRDGDDDGDNNDDEDEDAKELFVPISNDYLYSVVDVPQPPPPVVDDDEEDVDEDDDTRQQQQQALNGTTAALDDEDNTPRKPLHDEDVPDDDVTRSKVAAWTLRLVGHDVAPAHTMAVARSLCWPGAMAFVADAGRRWGCVYFGNGVERASEACYTPPAAPPVQRECGDLAEAADPTAAVEKLVRRGEEVPEADSEDEVDDEEAL